MDYGGSRRALEYYSSGFLRLSLPQQWLAQSQDTCGHHGMVVQVSLPALGSSTVDLLDFGLELGCHYLSVSPNYVHHALLGGISQGSASKEELASVA